MRGFISSTTSKATRKARTACACRRAEDPDSHGPSESPTHELTLDEAVSFYQQADDLLAADVPIIPLWFGVTQQVISERVTNVNISKFTFVDVAAVQVVEA